MRRQCEPFGPPVTMVSIAGINFDYGEADVMAFVEPRNGEKMMSSVIDETRNDSVWRKKISEVDEYVRTPDAPVIQRTTRWCYNLIPHLALNSSHTEHIQFPHGI